MIFRYVDGFSHGVTFLPVSQAGLTSPVPGNFLQDLSDIYRDNADIILEGSPTLKTTKQLEEAL